MFRQRSGSANITPVKEDHAQQKTEPTAQSRSFRSLKTLLVLSVFFGYRHRYYRSYGFLGGLMWLLCLLAHGGFDFLAARRHYGYGWASVSLFLFVSLFLCTVTTNNRLLPWLEIGMLKLEEEEKYTNTLRRVTKAVKWIPLGVLVFGVVNGGLTMLCLFVDNTMEISFASEGGAEPFIIPESLQIVLKIARFLCTSYVMSGFAYFWCVAVCVMHMTGFSMIEYHEEMTFNLKNIECPITFRQAVHSFAARGKFLKRSSTTSKVPLAFLVIYSIACLAVNAFLFLYKTRRLIFAVFALLPTICSIYPMCAAAWVTKQYQWYLAVVVKAWAERPESSDEGDDSESDEAGHRKHVEKQKHKRGKSLWKRKTAVLRNRGQVSKPPLRESRSIPLDTPVLATANENEERKPRKSISLSDSEKPRVEELAPVPHKDFLHPGVYSDTDISEEDRPLESSDPARVKTMGTILRGAARVVGKLQHRRKLPRFNFEKYISYLQNVLPNYGFNIMGIIVTWNMVSTIIFLELSLLALFVQESIFGNEKATVSL